MKIKHTYKYQDKHFQIWEEMVQYFTEHDCGVCGVEKYISTMIMCNYIVIVYHYE